MATNDITTNEYTQYVALREQIIKGLEEADSEFMLQTYSHAPQRYEQKAEGCNATQPQSRKCSYSRQEREEERGSSQRQEFTKWHSSKWFPAKNSEFFKSIMFSK